MKLSFLFAVIVAFCLSLVPSTAEARDYHHHYHHEYHGHHHRSHRVYHRGHYVWRHHHRIWVPARYVVVYF